jgi:hypothetical protein
MPTHFVAHWHHDNPDDPVRIFEEVADDRAELRKVEKFRDGRLVRADSVTNATTSLSWGRFPTYPRSRTSPESAVELLTLDQFEDVWERAVDSTR